MIQVELISPGTEAEDLGSKNIRDLNQPPNKWTVYEQILRIPYYFVFNRYTDELKAFILTGNHYQELTIKGQGIWLEEAQLGIGLWYGNYQGCDRLWLRCYNDQGNWILTPEEQEKQRADSAELELRKLKEFLQQQGIKIPQSDL